jgi:hypothetical protein
MIDRNTEEALLKIASELYFPDRSYKEIMEKAKGQLPAREMQQLEAFLERERRDLKMEDAILVLRRAKEITEEIVDEG